MYKRQISAEQKEAFGLVKPHNVGDFVNLTKTQLTENDALAKDLKYNAHEREHSHHEVLGATITEMYKLARHELNEE